MSSLAACDAISQTISFVLVVVFSMLSLPFYCDFCLVPLHFVNVFMYIEKYERIFLTAELLLHICDHNICSIYIDSKTYYYSLSWNAPLMHGFIHKEWVILATTVKGVQVEWQREGWGLRRRGRLGGSTAVHFLTFTYSCFRDTH